MVSSGSYMVSSGSKTVYFGSGVVSSSRNKDSIDSTESGFSDFSVGLFLLVSNKSWSEISLLEIGKLSADTADLK